MIINDLITYQQFREKYLCVDLSNDNLDENTVISNWEELNRDYNSNQVLPDLFYKVVQENYHPRKCGKGKYYEFLKTKYWIIISAYLRLTINKCEFFYHHDNTYLNIHHKTYNILGKELQSLQDLVCLCENCHKIFHYKFDIEFKELYIENNSPLNIINLDKRINEIKEINLIRDSIDNLINENSNNDDDVYEYLKSIMANMLSTVDSL